MCCGFTTRRRAPLHQYSQHGIFRRRSYAARAPLQHGARSDTSDIHFPDLARFRRRPFPLSVEGEGNIDRRPCLFLTFNNSKFTGGTMMIAPNAEVNDGLIEFVRWGPIGRLGLIRNLPTLYDGTHIQHPLAERKAASEDSISIWMRRWM